MHEFAALLALRPIKPLAEFSWFRECKHGPFLLTPGFGFCSIKPRAPGLTGDNVLLGLSGIYAQHIHCAKPPVA